MAPPAIDNSENVIRTVIIAIVSKIAPVMCDLVACVSVNISLAALGLSGVGVGLCWYDVLVVGGGLRQFAKWCPYRTVTLGPNWARYWTIHKYPGVTRERAVCAALVALPCFLSHLACLLVSRPSPELLAFLARLRCVVNVEILGTIEFILEILKGI